MRSEITSKPARSDRIVAILLGLGSAAVVVWQNSRLTVLWDLAYILENASRIAAGDVPYRDFPFPYAPLTFVVQALLIRISGRALWHHVAYAAIACAIATGLAYFIVRRITASRLVSVILTLPLIVLGIYCVFPHPFYDPDCCLVVLCVIALMLRDDDSIALGVLAVLPLFVKQNIGLALLAAMIVVALVRRRWRTLGGIAIGAGAALLLVATIFGLGNYVQWTIRFAAARRLPSIAQQLETYNDPVLWWWLVCVVGGAFIARRWRIAGIALIAMPWLWTLWRFVAADDPLEPQINLLRTWPLMIVIALLCVGQALLPVRSDRQECLSYTAFIIFATIQGTFLSQSTWGSTYGIWPLLVILFALAFERLGIDRLSIALAALIAGVTLIAAVRYVVLEERLKYAKVFEPWRPEFASLVAWTDRNIPRDDAILCLPGEDLFYFTTGRRPRVPVLMFDRTINPFDAKAIASFRDVRWVIVKKRLQLNGMPMENEEEVLRLLAPHLAPAAHLPNHDVYRRQ
jgi:hypothetical protein